MEYFYIITKEIKEQIAGQRLGKDVLDKLRHYLNCHEKSNDTPLMANVFISKIQQKSGPRFIWFQKIEDNVTVYILRRIYDHDEYHKKISDVTKQAWVRKHELSEEEKKEVNNFIETKKPRIKRDPLPEDYLKYEERPRGFEQKKEVIVYELPEWASGYQDVDDKLKKSVYDRLTELVIDKDFTDFKPDEYGFLRSKVEGYELCVRTDSNNSGANEIKSFFLLQVSDEINAEILHEHKYDCVNINDLYHKSVKCYPDFILCDFNVWDPIEDDNDANLALSTEELEILQNIEYPFFVSGLAGSGKSTILYYLFAHAYSYELKKYPDHKLLFLSYSKKLVSQARKIVKSILQHHPSYSMTADVDDGVFDRCFVPFQDFIRGEFLDSTDSRRFSRDKYIDYQVFKNLYEDCKLPEKKKYSADIVWSVIRTFIKGKDGDHYFTPKEYCSDVLSVKDRTVTPEDYENIFKIWNSWYHNYYDQGKGWDDLDLVRYALKKKDHASHFHQYAIVFCDEAQDFTKLETDLILKLSVHSQYDLTISPEAAKIPIAFAGDPNQTVNPTGFRWGSTQETFNQSFCESLKSFRGFRPNELRTNYRSREGIVKFANTIQYLRHSYLSDGKQSMSFQMAWDSDNSTGSTESVSYVAFYDLEQNADEINRALHKTVIITPDEGEYVVKDDTLDNEGEKPLLQYTEERKRALGIPEEVPNERLYTAITSKGLEFKSVILYRFANDKAVDLFTKIINRQNFNDDSELYNLAHFFTKLYIATSRAKQVLFIVDTKEGYEKFWKYFIDKSFWNEFAERIVADKSYLSNMGPVSMGNIDDFTHLLDENYKPKEYAESLFKNALDEESKDTMNRARSAYKDAHYEDKALLCEAYMYKFDKKYREAGDRFTKLGRTQDALDCYWEGQCWSELLAAMQLHASEADTVRLAIARYMVDDKESVQTFLNTWMENDSAFQESITNEEYRDVWNSVLDKISTQALKLDKVQITDKFVSQLDDLHDYFTWYQNGMSDLRAELHFRRAQFINRNRNYDSPDFKAEDYASAVKLWNEIGDHSNDRNYLLSCKYISKTPSERITWMQRLGEGDEILKKYGAKNKAASLTDSAQGVIFSLLVTKNMDKALEYPYPKDKDTKWNRLYNQDRIRFVTYMVTEHLSIELFAFLQARTEQEEDSVFSDKLPAEVFQAIFTSKEKDGTEKPLWASFATSLKDLNGDRVIKASANRLAILEILSKNILDKEDYDKGLASCMLELLFDKDFEQKRDERYINVIIWIFSHDVFFKEDFRLATKRNHYFTVWCNLTSDELDLIKNHIRSFSSTYLDSIKRISKANIKIAQTLFRALEIATPYQGTIPDYQYIIRIYTKHRKNYKDDMLRWVDGRIALNVFLDDASLQKASFKKFKDNLQEHSLCMEDVVKGFSIEDASVFVATINTQNAEYSFDSTLLTATLLYSKRLRKQNFMPYCRVNDLLANLTTYVHTAIDELTSEPKIDEQQLKTLAFTWEALYDHGTAASKYDELLSKHRKRLMPLSYLVEYLKKRALLHYSYLKQSLYRSKQEEYGIQMSSDYMPATYPKIDNSAMNYGVGGKYVKGRDVVRRPIAPSDDSAVHDNTIDIARNLKKMGLSNEQISQATKLSFKEIEEL